jgi:peptide-methionine (S)-S-oxide reductase
MTSFFRLVRRGLLGLAGGALLIAVAGAQAPKAAPPGLALATFAGGCFWCMEAPYDKVPGVVSTTSGYMGGTMKNPTYHDVSSGSTGHAEVVQVVYDPKKVSYDKLLEVYWHNVDPTVQDRQFCDVGTQYRTTIFVHTAEQKAAAEKSKELLAMTKPFKDPIVTPIVDAGDFWPAEDYHQDYYIKNPLRYQYYRTGCGRDARLKALWGAAAAH